jgi:hypothetical protein
MPAAARIGLVLVALCIGGAIDVQAQRRQEPPNTNGPWLGVKLPPKAGAAPAVLVGDRGPRPAIVPPDDPAAPEFAGDAIRKDLETIVGFSDESRAKKEIGSGQLWGRIAGFPSATRTVEWAVAELRKAGIADVKVQPIQQNPESAFWLPLEWEVRLLADAALGAGSQDVVLESAMPLSPSEIPSGTMTAPLVYVGTASPAVIEHIDVKGKIAVQLIVPQAHLVFERAAGVPRAQALMKKGAVAVFNLIRLPGNELTRDFSSCGGPCFNIGGRDGHFLEQVLDRAAEKGIGGQVRARMTLKAESRTGLKAENAVAVIPGLSDENIVINAHLDGWFDGAGDNGDGLAVLMALARHFAKPANKPARTLVFNVSAGHHSPGLNGPSNFVAANAALVKKTVMVINLEHVAQRNFSLARSVADDGYREAVTDSGEAPITAGISNQSPFLDTLLDQGVTRYGVNFVSERSAMGSGETGGFRPIPVALLTIMQAPPLYHTTGEVRDVISTPGLERMARFFAYFLKEAGKAPAAAINPAAAR